MMTVWRVGYVAAHKDIMAAIRKVSLYTVTHVTSIAQKAARGSPERATGVRGGHEEAIQREGRDSGKGPELIGGRSPGCLPKAPSTSSPK